MGQLRRDVVHAWRALARRRTYFLTAAATLALVLGANAAIFAVVNATLLRPLPFSAGERVVHLFMLPPGLTAEHERNPLQQMDFLRVRERARTLARLEGLLPADRVVRTGSEPVVVKSAYATPGLLDMLALRVLEGRRFLAAESDPGHAVVILVEGYRRRAFGDAPVIGSALTIDGVPHSIVGVVAGLPQPLFADADFLAPLVASANPAPRNPARSVVTIGELAEGASPALAHLEVQEIVRQLAREFPSSHTGWTGGAETVRQWQFGAVRGAVLLLFAAALFVLTIACVNIANLTIAGMPRRGAELALRLALGASPRDLMRLQLAESCIVGVCGAAAGLVLARAAMPALLSLDPVAAAALGPVEIDWRVQLVTAVLGVASGVAFAAIPALQASGSGIAVSLTDGSRRLAGGPTRAARRLLVSGEVAIAIALLIAGTTLVNDLASWSRATPGFDPSHVLTAQVRLPETDYGTVPARAQAVARMLEEIRRLPGVVAASTVLNDFVPGSSYQTMFNVEGRPAPDGQPLSTQFRRVSSDYFAAMRIRELAGRTFGEQDHTDAPAVVVISRQLADALFPGEDPLGRQLRRTALKSPAMTIVGIVDDVSDVNVTQPPEGTLYVPWAQNNNSAVPVSFVIRTAGDPGALAGALRGALARVAPDLPLRRVQPLETFVADALAPQRFRTTVLGAMSLLGLVLAAIGIYGVTERSVADRARELAVRLALGAAPSRLVRGVVSESLRDVLGGAVAGVAAGLLVTAALGSILPGMSRPGLASILAPVAVLWGAAMLAALAPSARVLRIDPADALRE